MRFPYLVQRATYKPGEANNSPWPVMGVESGLDDIFRWDYMGSAEFEFGALANALYMMRSLHQEEGETYYLKQLVIPPNEVLRDLPCWALLTRHQEDQAQGFLEDQLTVRKCRLHELSKIKDAWSTTLSTPQPDTWWALDGRPPFVLSMRKEALETFLARLEV